MFEKTQQAATQLSQAVTEETNEAVNTVKAMVVPAVAGFFASIAGAATKAKEGVESGEFLQKAKDAVSRAGVATADDGGPKVEAAPLPTREQNDAIKTLRSIGKTDEEISEIVGVSVLTVKMATE